MSGQLFFGRQVRLTIGTFDVSELRVAFDVTKSLKPTPNVATIKIYNLNQEHRNALTHQKRIPVRLEAGYKGALVHLYLGQVRASTTVTEGSDVVTTLATADSEEPVQKSRVHRPIGAGAGPAEVLQMLVTALGISPGNTAQMVAKLRAKGFANVYGKRAVLSGHAAQELTDFCRSAGIEWWVDDGKLVFVDRMKPLEGTAVELSADTGLIGSPTVDHKRNASARCFLIPLLSPGRKVAFKSEYVTGGYRVENVKYTGDTHGAEWYADLFCSKY